MLNAARKGDVVLLNKLMDPTRSGIPADIADTVRRAAAYYCSAPFTI
jgi:hypothetical protein